MYGIDGISLRPGLTEAVPLRSSGFRERKSQGALMGDLHLSRAGLRLRVLRGFNEHYIVHQLVADMFGDRNDRGYLYRVTNRAPREAEVLVLSDTVPKPGPIREWGSTAGLETRNFGPDLRSGSLLDFEIRINATQTVTQPDGRKKRVDIWDAVFAEDREIARSPHELYAAYLARRLEGVADVVAGKVVERGLVKFSRPGRPPISFVATNVIGTVRIMDPDRLMELLFEGLGRAKAFGCGLLCLSAVGTILPRRYPGLGIGK